MSVSCFHLLDWYKAITLSERLKSMKEIWDQMPDSAIETNLAQCYLDRWKTQSPFDKNGYFTERLDTENISESDFLRILGEPIEAVRDRHPHPPAWLTELAQAFAQDPASEPTIFPEALQEIQTLGFLEMIEPLIRQGRDRLRSEIHALIPNHSNLPFDPDTIENLLFINLPRQLLPILNRTLVLELNVARLRDHLQGETPEERFQSFIQRLRQRDTALSILQEYPVLARQLTIRIDYWVTGCLEFLQHLCADWETIRSQFTPDFDPGLLTEISGGEGDSHREGRSVAIAKFSSGFQIVYKPRSLSLDIHFQELLSWINDHGDHPNFRLLNICDRGTYGWVEFVKAQPCSSKAEIQRFYERQGRYLALLYALEAVDFHHENLIAAGEHPILLDLEALFHPRVSGSDPTQADQIASSTLRYSVYGIGLLPHRIWSNDESEGCDISGLGAAEGQLTPHPVLRWEGVGTDEMKLIRKRVEMMGTQNHPTLDGEKVNVLDYAESIMTGFTQMYHLLWQHRADLLAEHGPLDRFAGDTIRVIVRATRTYAILLMESFHPDVLRNALDRDRLLDRLWLGVEQLSHLAKLIPAEREDMLKGDIPLFTTRPESTHLWTSGGQQIADFLDHSGLASVRQRLQQLNEHDLVRQQWIIQASLTSLHISADQPKEDATYKRIEPKSVKSEFVECETVAHETVVHRDDFLKTACDVGDRLESLAMQGKNDASWIGLTRVNENRWSLAPLDSDLYDGLPGVILFLAYLGELAQENRYTLLSLAALNNLLQQLEQGQSRINRIGGFSGWGGVIYVLTHLGTLWQRSDLLDRAEQFVDLIPTLIEKDRRFDIVGGAAGCIQGVLTLYRHRPSDKTLAVAIQCGEHLVAHAQPMEQGCGWISQISSKALAGLSHGNAGIAWTLLELASLTGKHRFRETAIQAIAYERSIFSREAMNWPDLRGFATAVRYGESNFSSESMREPVSCMNAWCHGAPGIGLARLQSLPHLKDSEIHTEIESALQTTLAHGFGHNHSLCHGDLGNLELLLQASKILGNQPWKTHVDRLGARILENIRQHGWLCGIPLGVESPGLMTGLAGIGYGLLRLAEPTRVPSVLVLALPLCNPSMARIPSLAELSR